MINLNTGFYKDLDTNFEYAYEGQIAFLRQSSPSCWELIAKDYENDKLAEKIKEYFKTNGVSNGK